MYVSLAITSYADDLRKLAVAANPEALRARLQRSNNCSDEAMAPITVAQNGSKEVQKPCFVGKHSR
eukprot:11155163-Alexandrium_andersonii.AAC.1